MDIQAYIASGILTEYFLGHLSDEHRQEVAQLCLQHTELARELADIELAFGEYAFANAIAPAPHLKDQIWATLENLNKEKTIDLTNLPLINAYSDPAKWMGLVKPFIPSHVGDERIMKVLQDTPQVIQMFVVSKSDFEDETHDDLLESFIILEGECECTVGEDVYRVSAGGYTSIPLHVPHTVKILSPYVVAILQRVAV